jgi:1,2-diacylglycerol 3-beta-galactosyltransferase
MKVVILTSEAGGGHRQAAQALAEGFYAHLGEQVEVITTDLVVEHGVWPLNWGIRLYRTLAETKWLWRAIFQAGEQPLAVQTLAHMIARLSWRTVSAYFQREAPELVVTVYPLTNHAVSSVLRQAGLRVPFAVVVTDPISTPLAWFNPEARLCCVPTRAAWERAIKAGLPPEKVVVTGMPVGLEFNRPPLETAQQAALRTRLGLAPERPTALIVGGGEGIGPLEAIAAAVSDELAQTGHAQCVVICGRNQSLQKRLEKRAWPIPTSIHGFVDNMADWMCASDCLISKAGPGSIHEAISLGLPIILCDHIPGQEDGNVSYVVDKQIGAHIEAPAEIAQVVSEWLRPGNTEVSEMKTRARALAHPSATLDIVDHLLRLIPNQDPEGLRLFR